MSEAERDRGWLVGLRGRRIGLREIRKNEWMIVALSPSISTFPRETKGAKDPKRRAGASEEGEISHCSHYFFVSGSYNVNCNNEEALTAARMLCSRTKIKESAFVVRGTRPLTRSFYSFRGSSKLSLLSFFSRISQVTLLYFRPGSLVVLFAFAVGTFELS